jgi:hypothetical protein
MGVGRLTVGLAAVAVLGCGLAPAAGADWDPTQLGGAVTAQHHDCGPDDRPEGDIQGHVPKADQDSGRAQGGYNCGLALLGYTPLDLDGRPNQNANMAWAGRCAYIGGSAGVSVAPQTSPDPPPGAGVAVVEVSRRGVPTHVANIRSPGALATAETLHAVTTPDGRSILVVGQYGNDIVSQPKPMDVYDVSDPDCRNFRHLATFSWPGNIHNLTLSQDGRYVFGTLPLQAADISGLWDDDPTTGVVYLGNIEQAMAGPPVAVGPTADVDDLLPAAARGLTSPRDSSHEAWPSPDGRTLYVGGQTPTFEMFTVLDISAWLARDEYGAPTGPPRVVSQRAGRGHSVRTATIDGRPYVLHSEESVFGGAYGCVPEIAAPFAGVAQPWLTDISDPAHPVDVAEFGLEVNEPANCPAQLEARENDSVHYHDVDDPQDTTFVMASMWNAGLRIFDVRDPANPTEVAYFNPGDVDPTDGVRLDHAWGHVRYDRATGQIWFATADGGFWVVRLERQVRSYLGLGGRRSLLDRLPDAGAPGTATAALRRPAAHVDIGPYYCTLGALAP